jgi:hypothetical protein
MVSGSFDREQPDSEILEQPFHSSAELRKDKDLA